MAELKPVLTVAAIALGCALALAATHRLTESRISRNETAAERAVLADVLGRRVDDALVPDLAVQPAIWDDCGRMLVARRDVRGYGGPIRLLFTLKGNGRLARVVILGHQETPGITGFLQEGWLGSLTSTSAGELRAMDAITGATITSRAITDGLAAALDAPEQLGPVRPLCSS